MVSPPSYRVYNVAGARWEPLLAPSVANRGLWARAMSRAYGALAHPRRDVPVHSAPIVGVGSTTLGGGGKTPFAAALAKELSTPERPVALVVHGYRGQGGFGRVHPGDTTFGDDARYAATLHTYVYSAPTRAQTFAEVPRGMPIVLDGCLQGKRRFAASILLHDGRSAVTFEPPPCGPLRAPLEALYAAADHRLYFGAGEPPCTLHASVPSSADRRRFLPPGYEGLEIDVTDDDLSAISTNRPIVLLTAIARPERLLEALVNAGLPLVAHLRFPDHGSQNRQRLRDAVIAVSTRHPAAQWVMSDKCILHLSLCFGLKIEQLKREFGRGELCPGAEMVVLHRGIHVPAKLKKRLLPLW